MILGSCNFIQYTHVNMTWHGCGYEVFVAHSYFTLGVAVWFFSFISFYSFNFLSNNYIREKEEFTEKCIFVRTLRDKRKKGNYREKMGAFKKDIFTYIFLIDFSLTFFLIDFSFIILYPCTHAPFLDSF